MHAHSPKARSWQRMLVLALALLLWSAAGCQAAPQPPQTPTAFTPTPTPTPTPSPTPTPTPDPYAVSGDELAQILENSFRIPADGATFLTPYSGQEEEARPAYLLRAKWEGLPEKDWLASLEPEYVVFRGEGEFMVPYDVALGILGEGYFAGLDLKEEEVFLKPLNPGKMLAMSLGGQFTDIPEVEGTIAGRMDNPATIPVTLPEGKALVVGTVDPDMPDENPDDNYFLVVPYTLSRKTVTELGEEGKKTYFYALVPPESLGLDPADYRDVTSGFHKTLATWVYYINVWADTLFDQGELKDQKRVKPFDGIVAITKYPSEKDSEGRLWVPSLYEVATSIDPDYLGSLAMFTLVDAQFMNSKNKDKYGNRVYFVVNGGKGTAFSLDIWPSSGEWLEERLKAHDLELEDLAPTFAWLGRMAAEGRLDEFFPYYERMILDVGKADATPEALSMILHNGLRMTLGYSPVPVSLAYARGRVPEDSVVFYTRAVTTAYSDHILLGEIVDETKSDAFETVVYVKNLEALGFEIIAEEEMAERIGDEPVVLVGDYNEESSGLCVGIEGLLDIAPPGSHAVVHIGDGRPAEELAQELLEKGLDFTFYTYMDIERPEEGPDWAEEFLSGLVENIYEGNLSAAGEMGYKMPPPGAQTFEKDRGYVVVGDVYDDGVLDYKSMYVSAHLMPEWAGGKPVHVEGWYAYALDTDATWSRTMLTVGQTSGPFSLFERHKANAYIGEGSDTFKPYFIALEIP